MVKMTLYVGQEGGLRWEFRRKTHVLMIEGEGPLPDFSPFEERLPNWMSLHEQIHEIRLSEGIVGIGDYSFYPFDHGVYSSMKSKLHRVVFPSTLEFIGCSAFRANVRLQAIDLSNCTNLQSIEQHAFASCFHAKAVNLSGCVRLEHLSSLAFWACDELDYIDLEGCSSLSEETLRELRRDIPQYVPIIMPNGDISFEGSSQLPHRKECLVLLGGKWSRDSLRRLSPSTWDAWLPEGS